MPKARPPKPHKIGGFWYLVRRVPKEFEELDRRTLVRVSTEIRIVDDPRAIRAAPAVRQANENLEAYWRGLRDGQSAEARIRYDAAQRRARSLSLTYQTAGELAEGPLAEILKRIGMLMSREDGAEDEALVSAVLGGEARPPLMLSGVLDEFEAIQAGELQAMSPNQAKRWRVPRLTAMQNFINAVGGDMALVDLRRDHTMTFRRWWQDRVRLDGLDIATANKQMGKVAKMVSSVGDLHQLGLPPTLFVKLSISGEKTKQRAAFTAEWVQNRLLAPGALDMLNEDARDIILVVMETGMRPVEVCSLLPARIHLDAKVPHVQIRPDERVLKTQVSERDMPLVGVALEAMRRHPHGFPRYRDKNNSFSATANKALRAAGLLPTDEHSVYSLRHTFEDRLTAVDMPDKLIAALMGHKHERPKYGAGPTLEHKQGWLQRIAFKPPGHASRPEQAS